MNEIDFMLAVYTYGKDISAACWIIQRRPKDALSGWYGGDLATTSREDKSKPYFRGPNSLFLPDQLIPIDYRFSRHCDTFYALTLGGSL